MFSRFKNLLRINRLYGLIRDYYENPYFRTKKKEEEILDEMRQVTEFKEVMESEKSRMLEGKKTYIVAGLAGIATVIKTLGYIDESTYINIMGFLAAFGTATVAAKLNRTEEISKISNARINSLLSGSGMTFTPSHNPGQIHSQQAAGLGVKVHNPRK